MDPKRAKEIAASPVMASVTHHGVPIYIESVSTNDAMAYVHPLNQPDERQKVNVSHLMEQ